MHRLIRWVASTYDSFNAGSEHTESLAARTKSEGLALGVDFRVHRPGSGIEGLDQMVWGLRCNGLWCGVCLIMLIGYGVGFARL